MLSNTSPQPTTILTDWSADPSDIAFFRLIIDSMRPRVEVQEAADIIEPYSNWMCRKVAGAVGVEICVHFICIQFKCSTTSPTSRPFDGFQFAVTQVQIPLHGLFMSIVPLLTTNLPGLTPKSGKVRDIYDFGDRLLFIATDRISAFDWVLPNGIPDKGRVLTQISRFWFGRIHVPNHLLSMDLDDLDLPAGINREELIGRSMVVRKTKVFPVECVVRGYLSGSGWKEYCASGKVCGIPLPAGLRESEMLPEPIFTPATKAESGHDINISFEQMVEIVGADTAEELRRLSLHIYETAADFARLRGIIIADTKFEFGQIDNQIYLIDEVLTPDSSRFWPANLYAAGRGQASFDKQFVRDWLETTGWDKNSPPPEIPAEIVEKTRDKYIEAYEILTDDTFPWL
ncbi:MAG: purC [Planctomycetaceae bacterium]|nr:purC [Planctomycetaceae bacterium]